MAAKIVEWLVEGELSSDDVFRLLLGDCTVGRCKDELDGGSTVTPSQFVYEFISYLREQSSNVLENAPRTATLLSPRKERRVAPASENRTKTATAVSRQLNLSSTDDGRQGVGGAKRGPDTSSPVTRRSCPSNISFTRDEFPMLGEVLSPKPDASHGSPIVGTSKRRGGLLHSTPIRSTSLSGNLETAPPPLATEGIFNRTVPKSTKPARSKRVSLTLETPTVLRADEKANQSGDAIHPKKRIVPTPVKRWHQPSVLADFITPPEVSHSPKEATKKQKEIARTMRQESSLTTVATGGAAAAAGCSSVEDIVDSPKMEFVSQAQKLERVAKLYACCLKDNFVPNLVLELHFIMQLLVAKMKRINSRPDLLLGTVSNCGYFAVQVLRHSGHLLRILEPSTLALLKNLPHVRTMSIALYDRLTNLCEDVQSFSLLRRSFIQGVSFDASVDSADYFPSQQQFGAFRRQRDAFCELLKDWQEATFGYYNNELRFANRVRSIFDISMDPCNILHLARLFTRQLVATCCGSLDNDDSNRVSETVLQNLRSSCPVKFSKLEGRLEKPVSTSLSTRYQFNGQQAFFHGFILEANSAQFHTHLKNVLADRILEEVHQDVLPDDVETSIDSQIREELCTLLCRLKLYGVFLGLVEFLPYTAPNDVKPQVSDQQLVLRERIPPLIDLAKCLRTSIQGKRKTLLATITWITAYLSMADLNINKLSAYQKTWQVLLSLFRSCGQSSDLYHVMLRLMIGWTLHSLNISVDFSGPTVGHSLEPRGWPCTEDFVDSQLLHIMCPMLTNLHAVVADYYCLNVNEVRKIAPVAVNSNLDERYALDSKLEDTFFFAQPPSVKKIVAFIADRVPANVVKSTKPKLASQFSAEVKASLKELRDSGEELSSKVMKTLAQNLCVPLQLKAENALLPACEASVEHLVDELLDVDCGPDAFVVTKKICTKQCHERIVRWVRCYVSTDYVLDLIKEGSKAPVVYAVVEAALDSKPVEPHKASNPVAHIIDSLEHLIKTTLDGRALPPCEGHLENARQALLHRREWTSPSWLATEGLLVDLGMIAIVRTVKIDIAQAVVAILKEVGLRGEYTVDSARNRYFIKQFCEGNGERAKSLLVEYQQMMDSVKG